MDTTKPGGFIFAKEGRLYIGFKDGGKWRHKALKLPDTPQGRRDAAKVLQIRQGLLEVGEEVGAPDGRVTVRLWGERWIKRRKAKGLAVAREDEHRLHHHVYPAIGPMLIEEVRPRHIQAIVDELGQKDAQRREGKLAPRTVRHIFSTISGMFNAAVVADLIRESPCLRGRVELPPVVDKDRRWRQTAVFSREEAALLLGAKEIPQDRRDLYAVLLLTGMRFGEAAALTWRMWDPKQKPLGRITLTDAWNTNRKRLGATKTKRERLVPVHPVLAKALSARKLRHGAGDDDLVFPGKPREDGTAGHASVADAWKGLDADLRALELRHRRVHDMRRTFLSLALADGARPDILRLITHGYGSAVFDQYLSVPWATVCEAALALKVAPKAAPKGSPAALVPVGVPVKKKAP